MRNHRAAALALSSALALFGLARLARATPGFPVVVAGTLGMANTPPCALCHDGGRTGLGTVQTPFGKSVRAHGAAAADEDSLREALHAMDVEGTSSLHDGVSDTSKLRKGIDPNGGDSSAYSAEPPGYGCGGARIARGNGEGASGAWLSLVLGVPLLARRRRRCSVAELPHAATDILQADLDAIAVRSEAEHADADDEARRG